MRKIFLSMLAATLLFAVSCKTTTEVKKEGNANQNTTLKQPEGYSVEFKTNPAEVKAGDQAELSFVVKNPKGETVKDLEIVHEKPLHLLIVSEDLAEFYHEHPEQQADGSFKVQFSFKNGGKFKLYADFKPKDSAQTVKATTLTVAGNPRQAVELTADEKFEKTVDDLLVTMKPDSPIVAGKELMLNFEVFDANTKKPVTDLQNYLGEKAHFVVISKDLKDFVHAHPKSHDGAHSHGEKSSGTNSEATVSAHLSFPQPLFYKVFAQFKRNGKVITVPFVVDVKGQEKSAENTKEVKIPEDAFKITVSKDGFTPGEINITGGKFKKLAFHRIDAENCADEVIFKGLNIKKKLPVGEVVLVDLPESWKGKTIEFACGMDMYKGKIVVE